MEKISFIIITYNRPDDCLELLQDISRLNNMQELLREVVIVNNASTISYQAVTSFIAQTPQVPYRYINSAENLGVARGRNYAATLAQGEIMLFVDDDILLPDKDILTKIITAFSKPLSERPLGVLSFKVLYHSTGQVQVTAFPHKKYNKYKDYPQLLVPYYVGCGHAFKRSTWLRAGDYPPDFFYGMEEYDLSYRVLDAGYAIQYDASVVLRHKESPLGRNTRAEKLQMMWVNKSKVAWRYLPRQYFFTTTVLWSIEYLKKLGLQWGYYFSGWKKAIRIPFTEKRTPVSASTLEYLKKTEARLWY